MGCRVLFPLSVTPLLVDHFGGPGLVHRTVSVVVPRLTFFPYVYLSAGTGSEVRLLKVVYLFGVVFYR